MQVNVDKKSESDQELSELNDHPDVQQARDQVETSADKLKRKYWWKKLPREQVFPTAYKNRSGLNHA